MTSPSTSSTNPEKDEIVAFSRVGTADDDRLKEIYGMLLGANLFWQGARGATLSVEPDTFTVFIADRRPAGLPDAAFQAWLGEFVDVAEYWQARLARVNAGGPIDETDETPGPAETRRAAITRSGPEANPRPERRRVMSIGLDGFRRPGGDRLILASDPDTGNVTVRKAELKFGDRWVASDQGGNFWDGSAAHQDENREFKAEFYQALVKSSGARVADLAVKSAGLPKDWKEAGSALGSRQVSQVLDKAQMLRKCCLDENDRLARDFLKNRGSDNFAKVFAFHGSHARSACRGFEEPSTARDVPAR